MVVMFLSLSLPSFTSIINPVEKEPPCWKFRYMYPQKMTQFWRVLIFQHRSHLGVDCILPQIASQCQHNSCRNLRVQVDPVGQLSFCSSPQVGLSEIYLKTIYIKTMGLWKYISKIMQIILDSQIVSFFTKRTQTHIKRLGAPTSPSSFRHRKIFKKNACLLCHASDIFRYCISGQIRIIH